MREIYLEIAGKLEERIMAGEFKPNESLPSTPELAKELNVSLGTMQRSMKSLHERGLVRRSQQKGTFVSSNVNSHAVGFVCGLDPYAAPSPFWRLMLKAFNQLAPQYGFEGRCYVNERPDDPYFALRNAEADIAAGKLRCVMAYGTDGKVFYPWLKERCLCPWFICPSLEDLTELGVGTLLKAGYRNVVALSMQHVAATSVGSDYEGARKAYEAAGVPMPENALVRCGQGQGDGYKYVKKLLDAGKMPDALYVGHDVLANGVLLALYAKGLRAPRDLGLLAHQNKGAEIFAPLRLSVIQIDPAQIVRNAFDFIMGFGGRLPEGESLTHTRIPGTYIPGETMRS